MRMSDGSSDVCSSDLLPPADQVAGAVEMQLRIFRRQRDRAVDADQRGIAVAAGAQRHGQRAVRLRVLGIGRGRGAGQRQGFFVRPAPERVEDICLRSEEHTSELQSLMRISYAVFCVKQKTTLDSHQTSRTQNTTVAILIYT